MGNVPSVTTDGNAHVGEDDEGRDRALSFNWRAARLDWLKALGLPSAGSKKREQARSSILLEAVLAEAAGQPAVSYSRRKAFYAGLDRYYGTAFTYNTVVPTVDALARMGLLSTWIAPNKGPCGTQSTFSATPLLLEAVPGDLVANAEHAVRELVRLRDAEKRLVPYRNTERTDRTRRILAEQNEAIGGVRLDLDHPDARTVNGVVWVGDVALYPRMTTLYRVFNGDWNHGGRSYGGWWQQAPKALREHLLMDGGAVVEEDHKMLHPRLLYMLAGRTLEGDAYTLPGWDRKLCKIAFNVLLNASTYQAAVGAIANKIDAPDAQAQARRLVADMKVRHAAVADFFHSGIGARLQNVDADMAEAVAVRLLKKGIVALPIHDSFIVQERHREDLLEAMDASFARVRPFGTFSKSVQGVRPKQFHIREGMGAAPLAPAPMPASPAPFPASPPLRVPSFTPAPRRPTWRFPSAALPQGDLFGLHLVAVPRPDPTELQAWEGGIMPASIRAAARFHLRASGMRHDDLAARVGLSRPQLTNVLHGRFGTCPTVAAALKAFVLEATEQAA